MRSKTRNLAGKHKSGNFVLAKTQEKMDYKLIDKLKHLSWSLAVVYLIALYIFRGGHPIGAVIVATIMLFVDIAIFLDRKSMSIDLPECTLGIDLFLVFVSVCFVCLAETETDYRSLPMAVLMFVGAVLDIIRLVGTGAFRDKSFKEIFDEQLRFPIELDIILLFWPILQGCKEGWNSLDTYEYVAIGLVVLDLIHNLIVLPSVFRKRKQLINDYYQQLENEKDSLASVNIDTTGFDEETKKLVLDRIDLIDHILIGRMSGNAVFSRKVNKEIERVVADRASFIESLALHYAVSHPQAVDRLQQSGLSRYEIGLCCLYYMGYNGKEVKDITDTSMVYHVNSTIRQKLGLKTNDVNLSTFIRELFGTD